MINDFFKPTQNFDKPSDKRRSKDQNCWQFLHFGNVCSLFFSPFCTFPLTSFAYCTLYYPLHVSPLFNALSFDRSRVSRPKPIILLISQKKILFVVVASACLFFCGAQILYTLSFFYFLANSFISFIHFLSLFLSYFVVTWQSLS